MNKNEFEKLSLILDQLNEFGLSHKNELTGEEISILLQKFEKSKRKITTFMGYLEAEKELVQL